jgi:hypothetical protein
VATNPYLNTPPTELARKIPKAKGRERELMQEALWAWRKTIGNPLAVNAACKLAARYLRELARRGP